MSFPEWLRQDWRWVPFLMSCTALVASLVALVLAS